MNSKFNKMSVLCFLGMGAIAYGQQTDPYKGRVGINTKTPQATMQVKATEANLAGTTNEGIMAPQLSKTRVAAITTPVEGTLVYVTNETTSPITAYTGADLKVAKIDEKGYYFYNGTEWVKVGASGELWAQRTQNNTTETYLKPATTDNNQFYYHPKGVVTNLGGVTREDTESTTSTSEYGYAVNEIPLFNAIKSSALKENSTILGGSYTPGFTGIKNSFYYGLNFGLVNQEHAGSGVAAGNKGYVGFSDRLKVASDVTSNLRLIAARTANADIMSNTTVEEVIGVNGDAAAGNLDGQYSPTVSHLIGGRFYARAYPNSTVTSLVGSRSILRNYGSNNVSNMLGTIIDASSSMPNPNTGVYSSAAYRYLRGLLLLTTNRQKSEGSVELSGIVSVTNFENTSKVKNSFGMRNQATFEAGSVIEEAHTIYDAEILGRGAATVTDLYGFRLRHTLNTDFKPTNMYGIHLADVKAGTTNNYAIYTNAGNVRIGDLKGTGSRPIYANADGVLTAGSSTTNIALGGTNGIECNEANRGVMNFVKDVNLSDGSKADAFAVCLKSDDGFAWRYLYGTAGVTNHSGTFGTGL